MNVIIRQDFAFKQKLTYSGIITLRDYIVLRMDNITGYLA